MSLGDTAEADVLKLLFNNTNWALVGDATGVRGSTVAGSFFVGLATASLTDTATQSTSEAAYTSYARAAIARSTAGFTISGTSPTQAANAAVVPHPACTGGSESETYFVIGRDSSSTGEALWIGPLTSALAVSNGITPSWPIGALVATID